MIPQMPPGNLPIKLLSGFEPSTLTVLWTWDKGDTENHRHTNSNRLSALHDSGTCLIQHLLSWIGEGAWITTLQPRKKATRKQQKWWHVLNSSTSFSKSPPAYCPPFPGKKRALQEPGASVKHPPGCHLIPERFCQTKDCASTSSYCKYGSHQHLILTSGDVDLLLIGIAIRSVLPNFQEAVQLVGLNIQCQHPPHTWNAAKVGVRSILEPPAVTSVCMHHCPVNLAITILTALI